MIEIQGITKIYPPNIVALRDVQLSIKGGEFVSIVGQSGSGKTTLAKMLIAEEQPDEGKILISGWDITRIRRHEIPSLRRQIGMVFQDFKLLPKKTAFENVAFALEVSGASNEKIKNIVPQVLKIVGLSDKTNRYPRQLSGGQQQRAAIARALVHRPKILIADEPTGNLDSIHTKEIVELLLKINEFGTTVILVTHNKEVVNSLKRRVISIDSGQILLDKEEGRYII